MRGGGHIEILYRLARSRQHTPYPREHLSRSRYLPWGRRCIDIMVLVGIRRSVVVRTFMFVPILTTSATTSATTTVRITHRTTAGTIDLHYFRRAASRLE
jgi:hypothetical protein